MKIFGQFLVGQQKFNSSHRLVLIFPRRVAISQREKKENIFVPVPDFFFLTRRIGEHAGLARRNFLRAKKFSRTSHDARILFSTRVSATPPGPGWSFPMGFLGNNVWPEGCRHHWLSLKKTPRN
jgi:hypothetical protein